MKKTLDVIHKTIYQFFDVCDDDNEEMPMSDKDKLLLEVNKAICNNLKALEQEPLTEEDYIELHDRFGEYVEFVVRDMVSGKGERWTDKEQE